MIDQPDDTRFIAVLGKEFRGLPDTVGGWRRVLCPGWEQNSLITPGGVHRLVDWCLNQERELIPVDFRGMPISSS